MESMALLALLQNEAAHPRKSGDSPLLPGITFISSEFFPYKGKFTHEALHTTLGFFSCLLPHLAVISVFG